MDYDLPHWTRWRILVCPWLLQLRLLRQHSTTPNNKGNRRGRRCGWSLLVSLNVAPTLGSLAISWLSKADGICALGHSGVSLQKKPSACFLFFHQNKGLVELLQTARHSACCS